MNRRSLYFVERNTVEVVEEGIPGMSDDEVLVRSIASALSAGTEMLFFHEQLEEGIKLDPTIGSLEGSFRYPFKYGYATVGRIIVIGGNVAKEWLGRMVFAFHPHESHFTARVDDLIIVPGSVAAEDAVFLPSMETALSLVMDGRPVVRENVVVIGQGVIGLLTTSILNMMPLASLVTVDRFPLRRLLSEGLGATASIEPDLPIPLVLERTGLGQGKADLTYELSGNPLALEYAFHVTGFEGRVVVGSWYGNKEATLHFGEDFHRNRLQLISSQVSHIGAGFTGRWDKKRRIQGAWSLIEKVRPSKLITHRIDIGNAEQAYRLLDEHGDETVQVILTYGGE
jgi:NADPH:quinone reductase-like Zn-dependent oxidoreductase